jgi:hypothetical protein
MKKFIFAGLIGLVVLGGCTSDKSEAETNYKEGFDIVTVDKHNINNYAEVLKHKETGCHFVVVTGTQAVSVEQMFVKENGVSVPYCEKVGE